MPFRPLRKPENGESQGRELWHLDCTSPFVSRSLRLEHRRDDERSHIHHGNGL